MASPTIPAAPSPAPAAPPAPTPSSAPAASPAPSSTLVPSPAAPEGGKPAAPESQPAPAPKSGAAQPEAPKATDFPNTTEGQYEFAKVANEWYKMHPEDGKAEPPKPEAPKPADAPAEAAKPAEGQEQPAAPEPAAATPRGLAELMEKTPEFGAFMEAHPEVKGPVFALARKLAEAEPILAIAPTLGDAQFLQEQTSAQVALKTASLRTIENPEAVPAFLDLFDSQFQQVDAGGKPVLDAAGKPVLDPDHKAVVGGLVSRELQRYATEFSSEMESLKAKLGGHYPNEQAKALDQQRLDNLEYAETAIQVLEQIRNGTYFETGAPEPPADATPEQRAWFDEQKAKLDRQRQELEDKQKGASKEERATTAAAFTTSIRNDLGLTAGQVIGETLKRIEESGAYIPEMYKQEKYRDPSGKEWNTPRIAAELFIQFENELMKPGSRTLLEITQHDLLPKNDQTRQIRKQYYARKAAELIPGLVDKEVARIQDLVKVDQGKQKDLLDKRRQAASPEPSTGGSSLPQGASNEQLRTAAEEAAKKLPEWSAAGPGDRQAMILTQLHKMAKR